MLEGTFSLLFCLTTLSVRKKYSFYLSLGLVLVSTASLTLYWSYAENKLEEEQKKKRTEVPCLFISRLLSLIFSLSKVQSVGTPAIGGPFTLVDHHGNVGMLFLFLFSNRISSLQWHSHTHVIPGDVHAVVFRVHILS